MVVAVALGLKAVVLKGHSQQLLVKPFAPSLVALVVTQVALVLLALLGQMAALLVVAVRTTPVVAVVALLICDKEEQHLQTELRSAQVEAVEARRLLSTPVVLVVPVVVLLVLTVLLVQ